MRRVAPVGALALLTASLVASCSRENVERAGGDVAALALASVDTLQETDSLYVGRPFRAAFTPTRSLIVIDQLANRLVEFDASGRAIGTVGRAGRGPGEFLAPVSLARWGRDTLAVADLYTRSISLFALSSGEFVSRIPASGYVVSLAASGANLAIGAYSAADQTLAAWVRSGDSTVHPTLPFPEVLTANPLAMRVYAASFVGIREGTVAAVTIASNGLLLQDLRDGTLRELPIPTRRRRAIPESLDAVLEPIVQTPDYLMLIPYPDGVHWRDDGLILIWHKDWLPPEGGVQGGSVAVDKEATLRVYATLVDPVTSRACVDLEVPSDWAENPAYFADGTSLYALGHALSDGDSRPVLELRRYELPRESCDWQPLAAPLGQ